MENLYSYGKDTPIVPSFTWTDKYKLTTAQLFWLLHRRIRATYAFINRSKSIRIADIIPEGRLRAELDHVRTLHLTRKERRMLERELKKNGEPLFLPEFLDALENIELPPYELNVVDGQYDIKFPGRCWESTHWEIPTLTIMATLLNEYRFKQAGGYTAWQKSRELGMKNLREKNELLLKHPNVRFQEFGTRRADSPSWLYTVMTTMMEALLKPGQLLGTSNVFLASLLNVKLMGTMPHELVLIYSAIYQRNREEMRASQNMAFTDWEELYGPDMLIILPDTFGSEFTFKTLTENLVSDYSGFRWDSGDAIKFGERVIDFYQNKWGIDPKTKLLVPSDGLNVPKMIELTDHFDKRINVNHGYGTNASNDVGLMPASMVVKVIDACGCNVAKLSDNISKATGTEAAKTFYKSVYDYNNTYYEEAKY